MRLGHGTTAAQGAVHASTPNSQGELREAPVRRIVAARSAGHSVVPSGTPRTANRVVRVCRLVNRRRARYLVAGGVAANLHGSVRATRDVDLLIPRDVANAARVLPALERLTWGIARELDPAEVARKPPGRISGSAASSHDRRAAMCSTAALTGRPGAPDRVVPNSVRSCP
jgi:hypothetical protein